MTRVTGRDLRIGDVVAVWWQPHRDTVTALEPYTGPLAHLWPEGAQIIRFALWPAGMTAGNDEDFERISPEGSDSPPAPAPPSSAAGERKGLPAR